MGAVEFVNTESGENLDFEDVTGQIELKETFKNKRRNNKNLIKTGINLKTTTETDLKIKTAILKTKIKQKNDQFREKKIEKPVKNDAPDKNVSGNEQNQTLNPGNQPKKK